MEGDALSEIPPGQAVWNARQEGCLRARQVCAQQSGPGAQFSRHVRPVASEECDPLGQKCRACSQTSHICLPRCCFLRPHGGQGGLESTQAC